ncbi:uncharacterized protein LOC134459765 [Engraulis encrasicolus]|uniref:uncharacterized protein LOC134459765 n=1 Tax=Engraulis encrasicolus TaxID=184585 RepID=UPI002FD241BB
MEDASREEKEASSADNSSDEASTTEQNASSEASSGTEEPGASPESANNEQNQETVSEIRTYAMALYSSDIGLQFDETAENFENYEERFLQFLAANNIEEARKKAVFLSVVGPKTFALLKDLISPKQFSEATVTLKVLLDSLRDFYMPKKNVLAERFTFRSRRQQTGESFSDYMASLKGLASTCDFGANLEEQLRDQFVCGTSNNDLRRKLLNAAMGEVELKWAKLVEITNNFECTTAGLESMHKGHGQTPIHLRADHVGARKPRETSRTTRTVGEKIDDSNRDCYRCLGKGHGPGSCRFKEFRCRGCGKNGHLERACRSGRNDAGGEQRDWRRPPSAGAVGAPSVRSGPGVKFVDQGADYEPQPETELSEQLDMRLYTVKTE